MLRMSVNLYKIIVLRHTSVLIGTSVLLRVQDDAVSDHDQVILIQEYTGKEPDELSLLVGDIVMIEETRAGGLLFLATPLSICTGI